jgi:aldose 1-epimerase
MTENTILILKSGRTTLDLWTLGARINAVTWDGSASLLDGSTSEDQARTDKLNHGSVCGPVANRIAGGSAEIDGKTYDFEKDENGKTLLHSGAKSTRDAIWSVVDHDADSAVLRLDIADRTDDFPGNRRINAAVRLHDTGFDLTFTATTDAPTLINLAWHPYWTLGTDRAGLQIQMNSDRYLPVNEDTIPTGKIADVTGTPFDLRHLAPPSPDIDHNYCLPDGQTMKDVCVLASDTLQLDIATDAPGVQVFTGKPFGIAIEPQHWPDAPHHRNFPSILLNPGKTYRQTSRYRFSHRA